MVWDKVGSGRFDGGNSYVIERHVVSFPAPSVGPIPIRLKSYRWQLVRPDGTATTQARAKTRAEVEASIRAFRGGR